MKDKIKKLEKENIDLKQPEEAEELKEPQEPKIVVRVESFEDIRKRNEEIKANIREWNNAVSGTTHKPYKPAVAEEMNLNTRDGIYIGKGSLF